MSEQNIFQKILGFTHAFKEKEHFTQDIGQNVSLFVLLVSPLCLFIPVLLLRLLSPVNITIDFMFDGFEIISWIHFENALVFFLVNPAVSNLVGVRTRILLGLVLINLVMWS